MNIDISDSSNYVSFNFGDKGYTQVISKERIEAIVNFIKQQCDEAKSLETKKEKLSTDLSIFIKEVEALMHEKIDKGLDEADNIKDLINDLRNNMSDKNWLIVSYFCMRLHNEL